MSFKELLDDLDEMREMQRQASRTLAEYQPQRRASVSRPASMRKSMPGFGKPHPTRTEAARSMSASPPSTEKLLREMGKVGDMLNKMNAEDAQVRLDAMNALSEAARRGELNFEDQLTLQSLEIKYKQQLIDKLARLKPTQTQTKEVAEAKKVVALYEKLMQQKTSNALAASKLDALFPVIAAARAVVERARA